MIANCLFSQDQTFSLSSIPPFFQRSGPSFPSILRPCLHETTFKALEKIFSLGRSIVILSRSQSVRFKFAFTNFLLADSFLLRRSFSSVCILSGALLRPASGLSFEQSCTTPPHHSNFEIFLGCSYSFGIYPIFMPSNHQFCRVSFLDLPTDHHLSKVE